MATNYMTALRSARDAVKLSQLELSHRVGVSQRHISFVETGRARPSRELLVSWLETLATPLAVRDAVLVGAGFAPLFGRSSIDSDRLEVARAGVRQLVNGTTAPTFAVDAAWNVIEENTSARWFVSVVAPKLRLEGPVNLLELLVHPDGLLSTVVNLADVAPHLLTRLRHDAVRFPPLAAGVIELEKQLSRLLGSHTARHRGLHPEPVLTTRYATDYGELAFFTMFTTVGVPQDATLESLRIEHLLPADAATSHVLQTQTQTTAPVSAPSSLDR